MEEPLSARVFSVKAHMRLLAFALLIGSFEAHAQTSEAPKRAAVVIDNLDFESGAAVIRPKTGAESKPAGSAPTGTLLSTSTGRPALDKMVEEAARRYGLDPNLLISVMHQESGFNERAVSVKGARGLMQLIPATARRFGVKNVFDPQENIQAGAQYLRFLMDLFGGDLQLALAGYNAGEGAVIRYGYRLPPYHETRNYVGAILSRYRPSAVQSSGDPRLSAMASGGEVSVIPKATVFLTSNGRLVFSNNY